MTNRYWLIGLEVYMEVFYKGKQLITVFDWEDLQKVAATGRTWYAFGKDEQHLYVRKTGGIDSLHKTITGYQLTYHKDTDGLNNRRSNLLDSTPRRNAINRRQTLRSNNSTGFVDVKKHYRKWRALVSYQGKHLHIGLFSTPEKAAQARSVAVQLLETGFQPNAALLRAAILER